MKNLLVTILCSFGSAIVGGIIGGLFSIHVAKLNHKHEDKNKQKELIREANKNKPRLEILDYKGFKKTKKSESEEADISVLVLGIQDFKDIDGRAFFVYDTKALNNKDLASVDYLLENTGPTEIEEVCITSSSQRFVSVLDMKQKDIYVQQGFLNYDVWANKKYIKTKQTIRIRIYYIKDKVPASSLSGSSLIVWLKDVNGRMWSQLLLAPENNIEISRLKTYEDFKEATNLSDAIDCFRNSSLW